MNKSSSGVAKENPPPCPAGIFESQEQRNEVLVVALKSFALGALTAVDMYVTVVAYHTNNTVLLALSVYVLCACIVFHVSEFALAFISRPHDAHAGAFMLYHSDEYTLAQLLAWLEFFIEAYAVPPQYKLSRLHHPWMAFLFTINMPGICTFAALTLLFYAVRAVAMWQCAQNFSLRVQHTRYATHTFVQHGLYTYLRHPAYFGWFWRTMCAQLILANPVSFVVHTIATWHFFARVIPCEEQSMTQADYFGDSYKLYRRRTWVGIPFIA